MVCELCDRASEGLASGWRAHHSVDNAGIPSLVVLCPDCADEAAWLASRDDRPAAKPDATIRDEIKRQLAELEAQERLISTRRRRLHRRIEHVAGIGAFDGPRGELLSLLRREERTVSQRRRELHGVIGQLRDELTAS